MLCVGVTEKADNQQDRNHVSMVAELKTGAISVSAGLHTATNGDSGRDKGEDV